MKFRIYLIYALIIAQITGCVDKKDTVGDNEFMIKVTIAGLQDGTKIILRKQEAQTTITIDSTTSKKGSFEFLGTIETPEMYGIFIDSIQGGLFPLIESGVTTITAHKDSLYNPIITGSKLNDELKAFKLGSEKIVNKINDLFIQIQKARAENDLETINEINQKMRDINDENTRYSLDYAKNNPESYVASIVLQSVLRIPEVDVNEVQRIYNSFSEEVKNSAYAKNIAGFLQQNVAIQKDSIN